MPIQNACAQLSSSADFPFSAWRRQRTAQIVQRHTQFGMHRRLDVETILVRSARMIEAGKAAVHHQHLWAAAVASIEHCSR